MTNDQASTDTPAAGDGAGSGWLLLIYRVPPEPTRLRSTVWRRIKALGAIYLQNSVAALPASPANERSLRKLRREILDMSGTAILLSAAALAGDAEVRARSWRRGTTSTRRSSTSARTSSGRSRRNTTRTTSPTPNSRRMRKTW